MGDDLCHPDQGRPDRGRASPRRRLPAMGKPHAPPRRPVAPVPRARPRERSTPARRPLPAPWAPWSGLAPRHRVRALARDALRRFLRAVPREEADAVFEAVGADGRARTISRAALAHLIDTRLHARQRQVVRLGLEERWARDQVCRYLKDISTKTYERDQQEALDTLLAAIRAGSLGSEKEGGRHA